LVEARVERERTVIGIRISATDRQIDDILIATVARQHDLTLVSQDSQFAEVEGLETVT
jgi:predicted nucleic acid-binding protein